MSRPSNRTTRCLVVLASTVAALPLTGCSSAEKSQLSKIRGDLTPELALTALTRDELRNRNARINNRAGRDIQDDFLVFWHLDKPSMLSPYPSLQ